MKKYLFILILLLNIKLIAQEESFWEYLKGPPTGHVYDIAINSKDDIFIGTMNGIFRSTNHGDNWEQVYLEFFVKTMAIDKNDFIFADESLWGTSPYRSHIIYSTDNGNSWSKVNEPWYFEPYETQPLKIKINDNNRIYLLTQNDSGYTTYQIYYSDDLGQNWNKIIIPTQNNDTSYMTICDFDVTNDGKILCGGQFDLPNNTYVITFFSNDNGISWNNYIFPNLNYNRANFSSIRFLKDDILFVGKDDVGYYYSSDYGKTWSRGDSLFCYKGIIDIFIPSENEMYFGTYRGVFYTSDNGISWEVRNNGLENLNNKFVENIKSDKKNNIFATIWLQGIYRSKNKGLMWERINNGFVACTVHDFTFDQKGNIYAGAEGVFKSSNNGSTWELLGYESLSFEALVCNKNGDLFAGDAIGMGIHRTTDEGKTWVDCNNGLLDSDSSCTWINSLVINKEGIIFAGVGWGVAYSTNNGESWVRTSTYGHGEASVVAINSENHIFFGQDGGIINRSTDNGITWEEVNSRKSGMFYDISQMFFHPSKSYGFATGRDGYVFKTTNNGLTWFIDENSCGEALDSLGYLWCGCCRSSDDGNTWEIFTTGIKHDVANGIKVSPDGYLFLSTYYGGLYRSRNRFVSVPEKYTNSKILLSQNFPNPFDETTEIKYTLEKAGIVKLTIYNILVNQIAELVNQYQTEGEHKSVFSTKNLPSGVYFYRLEVGGTVVTKQMQIIK